MTAEQAVAQYYDAWRTRRGDMSGMPLADDVRFLGPVASSETADGFREMADQAVTSLRFAASSWMATRSARSSTGRWRCRGWVR
jgi:hypothetical protein